MFYILAIFKNKYALNIFTKHNQDAVIFGLQSYLCI